MKKTFKNKEQEQVESYTVCLKVFVGIFMILLLSANIFLTYLSFQKQWIQIIGGFVIFICLLLTEIINAFKIIFNGCSFNMINIVKYISFMIIFVGFFCCYDLKQVSSKKSQIIDVICGIVVGFFLSLLFGNEIKKLCRKKL